MKKALLIFCLLTSNLLFAQYGVINSVQIIPSNPTNIDTLYAVVQVDIGSAPCTLDSYTSFLNGSTIQLQTNYCGGMLSMICTRTDTINLGTLAAGLYNLAINMAVGCGPYTSVDSSISNGFTVGVFSNLNAVQNQYHFNFYPNPTSHSEITIQPANTNNYSLVCYNSLGAEVFAMNGLNGAQTINLPKENGVYLFKITDYQNKISVLKCLNLDK